MFRWLITKSFAEPYFLSFPRSTGRHPRLIARQSSNYAESEVLIEGSCARYRRRTLEGPEKKSTTFWPLGLQVVPAVPGTGRVVDAAYLRATTR